MLKNKGNKDPLKLKSSRLLLSEPELLIPRFGTNSNKQILFPPDSKDHEQGKAQNVCFDHPATKD